MPRILRRWALVGCLSAALPTLAPGDASGQLAERAWVTFRVTSMHHLAGLWSTAGIGPGGEEISWRHRVEPTFGLGATSGGSILEGFGLRVDGEWTPDVTLEADERGPRLLGEGSKSAYWLTGSAWVAPRPVCGTLCLSGAVGYGIGHFHLSQSELRGDIASPVADAQTRGVWRIGLELRLRRAPGLALQVADYVTDLEPFYGGDDLTPLHLLVVGVGLGTR